MGAATVHGFRLTQTSSRTSMSKRKKTSLDSDDAFSDAEVDGWDENLNDAVADGRVGGLPQSGGDHRRDWRDAEKYREERELRRQIDDLCWFDAAEKADRAGRPRR